MNFPVFLCLDRLAVVDRLAEQIEHAAEGCVADRHADALAGVQRLLAANQTVSRAHSDAACGVVADVLRDLCDQFRAVVLDFKGVEKIGKMSVRKFYIQYRADNLSHCTKILLVHAHISFLVWVKQPDLSVPHRLQFR